MAFSFILYLHLRQLKNLNLSQSTQRHREELNKKLTLRLCEKFLFNAGIAFPIGFAAGHTFKRFKIRPLTSALRPPCPVKFVYDSGAHFTGVIPVPYLFKLLCSKSESESPIL